MPLLDHFHPPLSERRTWEGFHGLWAAAMVETLNRDILAEEYYADMHVHVGSQVEVDVATLEEAHLQSQPRPERWTPPPADLVIPVEFQDDIEVQVFTTAAGASLVAAVELVSPANKDRPETRRAFAAKCLAYLTRGVGVVVVDVVTNRLANLHNELVGLMELDPAFVMSRSCSTYAVAYRPRRGPEGDRVEVWPVPLPVGSSLPVLPLSLRSSATVPLDLDATYTEACRRSRLLQAAA
jgi:hypothetical protein